MNKLIAILAIAAICLGFYWLREEHLKRQKSNPNAFNYDNNQTRDPTQLDERRLRGLPLKYEQSLRAARQQGAEGLRKWLTTYGHLVEDPRKAWIQLDYMVLIAAKNPAEARRIFAEVKGRTPQDSPVWPRIEKLSQTFE